MIQNITNKNPLSNNNSKFKAIIFDIDGTLYSNFMMFCAFPQIYIRNILWFMKFNKMRKKLRYHLKKTMVGTISDKYFHQLYDLSAGLFGQEAQCSKREASFLLQKHIYDAWIYGLSKTPLRYGMRLLLGNLFRQGIKLGILSDFTPKPKIEQWGIGAYFDVVISAEDYGIFKPDKRIFLETCALMECKPEEVLYVGNHINYDGIGATNAGIKSLIFHRKSSMTKYVENIRDVLFIKNIHGLKKELCKLGLLI